MLDARDLVSQSVGWLVDWLVNSSHSHNAKVELLDILDDYIDLT